MEHERIEDSPPRRSRVQLREWVQESIGLGHPIASRVRVAAQEDADARDIGLVVVQLVHGGGSVSLEPRGYDDRLRQAALAGGDDDVVLSPHAPAGLAAELVAAGDLCSSLRRTSREWDRASARRTAGESASPNSSSGRTTDASE
ncbi:hypothetical protein RWH44_14870 [Microbacterium sp. KSW2-29]|uniref:Uncharacterized protein n=1 Tax=Microbacterium phycohabitans TaxID=3075993 RepID=A0ABU3SQL7_9MICO|nr:hypothetical protein [Microbacterium sp. KSW2-29]MDU0346980.1 hypothetical protein [Microbacterium sp. KSW2-29]